MSARTGRRTWSAVHPRARVVSGGKVAAYTVLTLTVLVALIPFLYVISASLKQQAVLFTYPPQWIPFPPDFSNYSRLFSEFPFLRWTLNTLFVATIVTALRLVFDSLAAYGFAKLTFVGKRSLFVVMVSTILVPSGVLIIPLYFIARDFGLLDTYWALILPPLANPVGIFMLRAFIVGLPSELEQSARVDNCNAFQVYWWVILPLIKPGLVVVGMYHWLVTYTSFIWPLVAIENEDLFTLPLGLSSLSPIAEQRDWGLLSAAMMLTMVPLTLVFILIQRQFTSVSLVGALRR
jgi:ABC-type glycerol-3-phosphate transport system permease component